MIESIDIQNFQSHKATRLDFSPGVNAIVGQTDSGKSAIFRALRLVLTNQPNGRAFRSHWGGDTIITLGIDETEVIREYKGKGGNSYFLGTEEHKAFGREVPGEIRSLINLSPISIQRQADQPYLLSNSPPEIARQLNAVASLDLVDESLNRINSMVRAATEKETEEAERIEALEMEVWMYEGLEELEDLFTIAEETKCEGEEAKEKARELRTLSTKAVSLLKAKAPLKAIAAMKKDADELEQAFCAVAATRKRADEIQNLLSILVTKSGRRKQVAARRDEAEKLLHEIMPDVCPLCLK